MKVKNYFFLSVVCLLLIGWGASCTQVDITMPKGPKGDIGLSSYEFWKEKVADGSINWPKDKVEVTDYFIYLKGKDGVDGKDGKDGLTAYEIWKKEVAAGNVDDPHNPGGKWDASKTEVYHFWKFLTGASGENGQTPHIGTNGNWWIGDKDTGITARGKDGIDGKDAIPPKVTIGDNGNWFIDGTDSGKAAKGKDGIDGKDGKTPTITIGENGNWVVDGEDTGKAAKGIDGKSPEVAIGNNGNWYIDGKDTGVKAYGKDGVDGSDGVNGVDGKSAYQLWKESVELGCTGTGAKVMDPKDPTKEWDCSKTSTSDFYEYLQGKDGLDGKSAYELWKERVEAGCNGTGPKVMDPKDPTVEWSCEKTTESDFFEFLRGKDGKDGEDGKDGKPGEPGRPGTEVTVIKGIPNVICQYSQSEFGEYVRTSDGGVLYKVYDENGELAPNATVKGMPGIDPNKVYTSNADGEFIVPKEDLPEIQSVDARWGKVSEVTIEGKAPKLSAKNTYVPNRVHVRMIIKNTTGRLDDNRQLIYFYIQRKINPEDEWQDIPTYLPNSGNRYLDAYQVADKLDPKSIMTDKKIYSYGYSSTSSDSYYYRIYIYQYMIENPGGYKNGQVDYWDGTDIYYSVKARDPYYGEEYQWNGVGMLPPLQIGPVLKILKLKSINSAESPSFASAEGVLDFSAMDMTKIYKSSSTIEVVNGIDYLTPVAYTEEEAKNLKMAYVKFKYSSSAGDQEASSYNNRSSFNEPGFKVLGPFLNAAVSVNRYYSNCFYNITQGKLEKGTLPNTFVINKYYNNTTYPEVTVTYED